MKSSCSIAILIPCLNEAATIERVIKDFRNQLPKAEIVVCDNNSQDDTATIACRAGASVIHEAQRGKGNVIRRMFADIDADLYLMVDGDATYDCSVAPRMVALLKEGYDLVNVARKPTAPDSFRGGHRFGNRALTALVGFIFGTAVVDALSGYKAFSRRLIKTFPALSSGFEIETEILIHALELRVPICEIAAEYRKRPHDSPSKLRTFRDAFRILRLIGFFVRHERPIAFFSSLSALLVAASLWLGLPVVADYFATGLVPRLPTAVLAASLIVCAVVSFFSGVILDAITQTRREIKRLNYLSIPPTIHIRPRYLENQGQNSST
jgi:glycosyltransferase involved in cell wall biosynthesis